MIAGIILTSIPMMFIVAVLAAKMTKLLMHGYDDQSQLIFNATGEKVLRIAVGVLYVLLFCTIVSHYWEKGYSFALCLCLGVVECSVYTVLPPLGIITAVLIFLVLKNRKRKLRRAAALEEQKSGEPTEPMR